MGASTGAVFNTKTNQWERSFGTEGQQHVPGSENTAPAAHASPSNIVVPGQMYRPRQPDPRDPNGPHGSLDNTGVQVSQTNHISLEGGVSAELVEPLKRVGAVLASFLPNPNSAGNLSTIRSMGVA